MVRGPGSYPDFPAADLDALKEGATLISFTEPLAQPEIMKELAERKLTVFSMELIRITSYNVCYTKLLRAVTIATLRAPLARTCSILSSFIPPITVKGTLICGLISLIASGPKELPIPSLVLVENMGPMLM